MPFFMVLAGLENKQNGILDIVRHLVANSCIKLNLFLLPIASTNLDGMDFRTWEHENIEKPEFLAIDYLGRNFYYSGKNFL